MLNGHRTTLAAAGAAAPDPPSENCALNGAFYLTTTPPASAGDSAAIAKCTSLCEGDSLCGGFTYKKIGTPGGQGVDKTVNCTAVAGSSAANITGVRSDTKFDCWAKTGSSEYVLTPETSPFSKFWSAGINSPHSAMTLREDWRSQMKYLKDTIGYNYTRIHAPFSRDYSVTQGPNATSMFNPFSTYDALLALGVKPWIELGYTPCFISGPPAVPRDSYWPTVDYGICVGPPTSVAAWTDLIDQYVAACVTRYGVEEVETWVWVMYNEPGGINAYSADWSRNGFTYYDLFWNTSRTIKQHSPKMTVGGLSDGPEQGAILAAQMNEMPEHKPLLDFFSYHHYCNGQTAQTCGAAQVATVASLREVLPSGMPIFLEETGSSAGPYDPTHDETFEAAFVVPYVAAMAPAELRGAHWWVSSDLYTEHGSIRNYTWIPNEDFSGGMPRAEFTGRWGFITPNSIPKPITRAFQLLAAAGSDLIVSSATSSNCTGASVVAVANSSAANSGVMVFVSNQGVASCDVTVNLGSWASESTQGWVHSITANGKGDPKAAWVAMGSPPFPTAAQINTLLAASVPEVQTLPRSAGSSPIRLTAGALSLVVVSL